MTETVNYATGNGVSLLPMLDQMLEGSKASIEVVERMCASLDALEHLNVQSKVCRDDIGLSLDHVEQVPDLGLKSGDVPDARSLETQLAITQLVDRIVVSLERCLELLDLFAHAPAGPSTTPPSHAERVKAAS